MERKISGRATWRELLDNQVMRLNHPQEWYDALVRGADVMLARGTVDPLERYDLVELATAGRDHALDAAVTWPMGWVESYSYAISCCTTGDVWGTTSRLMVHQQGNLHRITRIGEGRVSVVSYDYREVFGWFTGSETVDICGRPHLLRLLSTREDAAASYYRLGRQ